MKGTELCEFQSISRIIKICSVLKIKTSTHLGYINPIHRIYEEGYLELCVGCWVWHIININDPTGQQLTSKEEKKNQASVKFKQEDALLFSEKKELTIPRRQSEDPCFQATH